MVCLLQCWKLWFCFSILYYDTEKAEFLARVKFCILAWHETIVLARSEFMFLVYWTNNKLSLKFSLKNAKIIFLLNLPPIQFIHFTYSTYRNVVFQFKSSVLFCKTKLLKCWYENGIYMHNWIWEKEGWFSFSEKNKYVLLASISRRPPPPQKKIRHLCCFFLDCSSMNSRC